MRRIALLESHFNDGGCLLNADFAILELAKDLPVRIRYIEVCRLRTPSSRQFASPRNHSPTGSSSALVAVTVGIIFFRKFEIQKKARGVCEVSTSRSVIATCHRSFLASSALPRSDLICAPARRIFQLTDYFIQGDSGGGLQAQDPATGQMQLLGVISYGVGCNRTHIADTVL